MLRDVVLRSFFDELSKIAAKVPFIHGTSGRWPLLNPGFGTAVLKNDPNPRAVYTAMKNRRKLEGISGFAREAVAAKGGEPVVAMGKMDTAKGWLPSGLSDWGRKNIGSVEDAQDLVHTLDATSDKGARGEIWRKLHKGIGQWRNEDAAATLKPAKYKSLANG